MLDVEGSRVVTVGSMGHWLPFPFDLTDIRAEGRYNRFGAYARSKVANLMFTLALHRRLARAGAPTVSVASHPGGSNTELAHQLPLADLMSKRFEFLAQPPAMGALGTLRAATDPEVSGGQYYGPNRRLEMHGHPIVVRPSARTQDRAVQEQLWSMSEELTGVRFPVGDPV